MSGVSETFATRQPRSATGGANDHDLADVAPPRRRHAEVGQQLKSPGTNNVATRFVAREVCFVDQCHLSSAPRQDQSGDTARWAATYNDDVEAR
jgi:hypothetical protein